MKNLLFSSNSNGFSGINCQIPSYGYPINPFQPSVPSIPALNPCNSNPCSNGGQCICLNTGNYYCVCPNGYIGLNCESANQPSTSNPCLLNPCLNSGQCVVSGTNYYCVCVNQYSGTNCQYSAANIPINSCLVNYCQNGGSCIPNNVLGSYYCQCW